MIVDISQCHEVTEADKYYGYFFASMKMQVIDTLKTLFQYLILFNLA